jgi:ethanolaminephosphotransferase
MLATIARANANQFQHPTMISMSWQSRSDRSKGTKLVFFTLGNVLLLVSLYFFTTGFLSSELFPSEAFTQSEIGENGRKPGAADPPFDRVVFLLIDTLRPDFVYGRESGFEFTQGHESINVQFDLGFFANSCCCRLINDGSAIPFTAYVAPPTVTSPRLKAITTGSIPGFADVMGNLDQSDASSSQSQDSWLSRLRARDGRLVFYGDDTWLRLFGPSAMNASFFSRSEGVNSLLTSVSWDRVADL